MWYLEADTDDQANRSFVFGTTVRNSDGSLTNTPRGAADYGDFNALNSSITMKVNIGKLNALETHGLIGDGTMFIGLRGSAAIANFSISVDGVGVAVGLQDSTRPGTPYTLSLSSCAGAQN